MCHKREFVRSYAVFSAVVSIRRINLIECISFCLAIAACISHESARRSVISDKPLHIDVLRNINVIFYSSFLPSFAGSEQLIDADAACRASQHCVARGLGWDGTAIIRPEKRVPPSVHVSKNKLRFAFCMIM